MLNYANLFYIKLKLCISKCFYIFTFIPQSTTKLEVSIEHKLLPNVPRRMVIKLFKPYIPLKSIAQDRGGVLLQNFSKFYFLDTKPQNPRRLFSMQNSKNTMKIPMMRSTTNCG